MRRVDTEGDSLGSRGRKLVGARPGPSSSRSHLRRASLEALERRELLSNLPTPVASSIANLVSTNKSSTASANSPSVAIDPSNPQNLIAAWVVNDTANQPGNGQVTSYVEGAYSINGGVSWRALGFTQSGAGSANVQSNFSISQMGGPFYFHLTSDASVAFDRNENAYLLTSTTTDGSSGVIDLQRFDFTNASAGSTPTQTLTNKPVYSWNGSDAATNPVLVVDNNLASFSDVNAQGNTVTQTDPSAGNVYVAWASTDTNRGPKSGPIGNFNSQTIRMVSSSDRGQDFTHIAYVDDTSNVNQGGNHSGKARYVEPSLAISQGRVAGTLTPSDPGVQGGQVSIVYDDYGTGATAPTPYDRIVSQVDQLGGADAHFTPTGGGQIPIPIAIPAKAASGPDTAVNTDLTFNVNITDPKFTTLQNLDVTLRIAFPTLSKVQATLIPPTGLTINGQPAPSVTLFQAGVDGSGTAIPGAQAISGTNLGNTTGGGFGAGPGTVFDSEAIRRITDDSAANPYLGHYRPVSGSLSAYNGLTAGQLNGQWTIRLTVTQNDAGTTGSYVQTAALDFTSGNDPGFNAATGATLGETVVADFRTQITVTTPNINPQVPGTPTTFIYSTGVSADPGRVTNSAVQAPPILPTPKVAIDNTLGAYSPHQGRIYVAYTGRYSGFTAVPQDQTDIFLVASDDGGQTWNAFPGGGFFGSSNTGVQVNDDNAIADGFSEASPRGPAGVPSGRPQLEPQVAIDQSTGGVVVSFLDARNDPARARVATYLAVSNDGGQSFAPETYANRTNTATDAITGNTVNLGPVPDNQSAGSVQDPFGFGQHQGLAVAGGKIIPVWSSNQNRGNKTNAPKLFISSSILTDAAGPRVISGTMGPVGEPGDSTNATRSAVDGSPVANTILLSFDRPIDPATFQGDGLASTGQPIGTGDVRVYYQDPYGPTVGFNVPSTPVAGFFGPTPYNTTFSLSGHPNVPVVDGTVHVVLANFSDLGQVTVRLVAPSGHSFVVPTTAGTTSLNETVALPANMLGGSVDGNYYLQISSPGQSGTFVGFAVQLNGVPIGLRVTDIVPLDNGNFGATNFRVTFDPTDPSTGVPTGVGTYSYIVRPNLSDRIRNVLGAGTGNAPSTITENALSPQVPLPLTGTATASSSLTLVGHPGKSVTGGTLTLKLTDTNYGDLTVSLVGPGSTRVFPLNSPSVTQNGQTYTLVFNLPTGLVGQAVDGQYQLRITGGSAGDKGVLQGFSLRVLATGPNGNAMDQNSDGTPGQDPETTPFTGLTPGDDFVTPMPAPTGPVTFSGPGLPPGPYASNSLPLIVAGPHVTTTTVTGVNGTTTSGTDNNLILNDQVNSVVVNFDRKVQVASVTPQQVLNIIGPAGPITGPQTFNANVARTFSSTDLGPIRRGAATPTVSMLNISATGLTISNLQVTVNIADPDDSTLALTLIAPDGTMVPLVPAGVARGANFSNTTFSDAPGANGLTNPIASGQAPYGLIYQPTGQPGALGALRGKILDGTWRLVITDTSAATNAQGRPVPANRLNSWSLSATPLVPDNGFLDTPLTVPSFGGTFTIADLAVKINVTSPIDGDYSTYLIAPDGTVVPLFLASDITSSGSNFTNTSFSTTAPIVIGNGVAPYTLTYRPVAHPGSATLASLQSKSLDGVLNGKSAPGIWTLRIVDNYAHGLANEATLNSWSLIATPRISVTALNPTTGNNGVVLATSYRVSFPTQQLSGTYAVTLGAGILGADPSQFNPAAPPPVAGFALLGAGANPNLNAGVDVLKGTSNTGSLSTTPVTYQAQGVPVAIVPLSAVTTNGAPATNAPLVSSLVVPDHFLIQPGGLTVQVNIAYPNNGSSSASDSDLSATLIAPNGQRIDLFAFVGAGTTDFRNTIFDDKAAASVQNAGNHFAGRFTPKTPLGNLAGADAGGTWKLEIDDRGTVTTGTLLGFSLTFRKPQPASGLGDPVADRQTVDFRIFNIAPSNPLANDTFTAIGPAGVTVTPGQRGTLAGPVASIAYDPSDTTRNTVYVAAASGGIWKTNNFLTSAPSGPTYVPLTDFGPNFGLDIGSIAVYGRNSDPSQSIVIAGTGFAQATYPYGGSGTSYANFGGPAGRGVGFLRSSDGGQTFTLLDSSVNVDASGNSLPMNSPARDHKFIGDTTYKVVVDPTPLPNGNVIVYAALGGPTGGLYRSLDTGATWTLLKAGTATDITLDLNSKSPTTGNVDIIYAAFQGLGVFSSTNRGQGLTLVAGQLGNDPLIAGAGFFPQRATTVGNSGVTPNGANGRIILGKPALTGNVVEDLLYQDWLFAAVENTNGTFNGLYVTKDRGQNWTKALLSDVPDDFALTIDTPTNDNLQTNSFDPTSPHPANPFVREGNYNLTMTVDPTNPNLIYLGGSQDFKTSGLIRVDITNLFDAHNFTSFSSQRNDGGKLLQDSAGAINVLNPTTVNTQGVVYPSTTFGPTPYLNLTHAPNTNLSGTSPFNINATLLVRGVPSDSTATPTAVDFNNDGTGVKWSYLDEPLKANPGDVSGSTNLHDSIAFVDPVTGHVRLIFADDQGVFTALLNSNGSLDNGVGTAVAANYSRNGNLQDEQFYYGAAQPSNIAAQAAGARFYASGLGLLAVQSDPNILANGNTTYDDSAVVSPPQGSQRDTGGNLRVLVSSDRGGVGIATDPTGGSNASGPTGSGPSVYEYDVPSLGGNITDFFRVNGIGQTNGLANNYVAEFPFGNYKADATSGNDKGGATSNGVIPLGNFTVNPLDGSQILIGSALGRLYETTNKGVQWNPIGQPTDFDGTQLSALAYGAPDTIGTGNQNDFIYVGTVGRVGTQAGVNGGDGAPANGGHIYVTQTGGQSWIDVSQGLDGASVVAVYPSPNQGDHSAYAVTLTGVFYTPDSVGRAATNSSPAVPAMPWVNITSNLNQIQRSPFGDPSLAQSAQAPFTSNTGTADQGTASYGGFRSIVADYRYAIPDALGATNAAGNVLTHPVLYVAGTGGVFRSLDNGQTWTLFPSTAFDTAPVDGGYLPSVQVTSLTLNLGPINPATGRAEQSTNGQPSVQPVLMATTFGRGNFAIGLAPDVFNNTLKLDPTQPAPGGSDSGVSNRDRSTNVKKPFIAGFSEISNFGNVVTITLLDLDHRDSSGNFIVLGTGQTDANGQFSIQVGSFNGVSQTVTDPAFFLDGVKNVGIQATDSSGATGNVSTFTYTLRATKPPTLAQPILETTSDSGRYNNDGRTNFSAPVFDIATTEPATTTVELFLYDASTGAFDIPIGSAPAGIGTVKITDTNLNQAAQSNRLFFTLYYVAVQVDQEGNKSDPSPVETIVFKSTLPATLPAPSLEAASNSGLNKSQAITNVRNPTFDVTGLDSSQSQVFLYRSIGGSAPIRVGAAAIGGTTVTVSDQAGASVDGTYVYQVVEEDVFGNDSVFSQGTVVTINTQAPPQPTLAIFAADDSGAPTHPEVTNVSSPRFTGRGTPGLGIVILVDNGGGPATGTTIASTTVNADGTYLAQVGIKLPDYSYRLFAQTVNAAGNISDSAPLSLTIKATGPQIVPSLTIFGADDSGIKGDGVTVSRRPRFVGRTDPGDTVTLYAYSNGQLSPPEATATASTINGSFQFQLPFDLTDGSTQLVAQASDVAGNKGPISALLTVRIVSVAGDYAGSGRALFTVFNPTTETYSFRNAGSLQVDVTPGRDVPVQYDFNGDGRTDSVAYRFNSAEYIGYLTNNSTYDQSYTQGNVSLPVSGYYDNSGTLILGSFNPTNATWSINLPTPGGRVISFGAPNLDIPVPAAYNGNGVTEITYFRPRAADGSGTDADSFTVLSPYSNSSYRISFTDPAVIAKGFTYQAGDIPAPADYDGVGRAEFALYRPSTGQFFILNTPLGSSPSMWTLRTVTLNFSPTAPQAGDVPVSQDYEGTGKASPAVYRPSNSTFYEIQTTNGVQQNIPFGTPGMSVAAAGPLLYRLSALTGSFATTDGYPSTGSSFGRSAPVAGNIARAASINASATDSGTPATLASSSTIALATPTPVVTEVPMATIRVATLANPPAVVIPVAPVAPVIAQAGVSYPVTFGTATPRSGSARLAGTKAPSHAAPGPKSNSSAKPVLAPARHLTVHPVAQLSKSQPSTHQHQAAVAAALTVLAPVKMGRRDD